MARVGVDFAGSGDKATIRKAWDLPILQGFTQKAGRKLSYFGLPGPAIEDLLDWRDILSITTGVERLRTRSIHYTEDLNRHRRLLKDIMVNGIEVVQLLRVTVVELIS